MILKRDLVGNTCRLMTRTRLTIRSLDHAYFLRSRWVSIKQDSQIFIFANNFVFYKQSGRLQVIKHLIRRSNKKRRYVYLKLYTGNSGEYTQSIHRNMRVDLILSLYTDHLLAISPSYRIL